MSETPAEPLRHFQTRALQDQADRHAVTLEALLAALRSTRLDDRAAREAATSIAATALVQLRSAEESGQDLLEPVVGAFSRLKDDLQPMVRFGTLDLEFVEPPANGRALPGEVARAARAMVRSAVLTSVNTAGARRVRVHWDCDGLNLLIGIRDDGAGELHAHDDALRPVVEHATALDGQVSVSSTPGWGTELSVVVPLDPAPTATAPQQLQELSPREREVLHHLGRGARNAEIAAELDISAHTVKFHISKLLRRTGARNRAELIALLR